MMRLCFLRNHYVKRTPKGPHGAGPRSSLAILLARFTADFFSHSGHRRQQRHQWREFPDLPPAYRPLPAAAGSDQQLRLWSWAVLLIEIGRASCRERVDVAGVAGWS